MIFRPGSNHVSPSPATAPITVIVGGWSAAARSTIVASRRLDHALALGRAPLDAGGGRLRRESGVEQALDDPRQMA